MRKPWGYGNVLNRALIHSDAPFARLRRQLNNLRSFVSKKTAHPFIPIHPFLFLSLLSACLPPPRRTARPVLGCRPYQAQRAAVLSKSHGRGLPAARAVNGFLPRRAATATGLPPTSTAGPLPPMNTTHRRASILPSGKEILR
jgi:hypothetical protein